MCGRQSGHSELTRATQLPLVLCTRCLCPLSLRQVHVCAWCMVSCSMELRRRVARRAWCGSRWLVVCVLLDCVYLAPVHHTAPVADPRHDNNHTVGADVTQPSPAPSAPLSLASHPVGPLQAALMPASSSSSLSLSLTSIAVNDQSSDNMSLTETDFPQESEIRDNASRGEVLSRAVSPHDNTGRAMPSPHAGKVRKEFPLALVVASATAAVSILLMFCLSYLWHTRQLDRRAQKLAIRLAAQADADLKCAQCRPRSRPRPRYGPPDSGSDSGGEDCRVLPAVVGVSDEVNSLHEEDEDEAEDGSRRKPGGVGRTLGTRRGSRGRSGGRRSGSRSSRKWSGHSSGATRSSLVTDQEILSHFASRRHSTFFI